MTRSRSQPSSFESARNWEGDFAFVVEPDAAYDDTAYLFLGLYHGKSTEAAQISQLDEKEAAYLISAPFSTWRKVIEGKLDPIQGLMTRRLKLKGNMKMPLKPGFIQQFFKLIGYLNWFERTDPYTADTPYETDLFHQ